MDKDLNSENNPQMHPVFRWLPIFEVLSMDCVSEFGIEFGLKLEHSNRLKAICRDCIRDYYDNNRPIEALLPHTLENLRQLLGDDIVIEQLVRDNYENYREQDVQSRDWVILFGRLSDYFHVEDYPLVPLNLSKEKIMLLKITFLTYIAKVNRFRLRICEIKHKSLSQWDTYLYSKNLGKTDPLLWLENQIVFNYKIAQWKQIQDFLVTPNDIQMLEEWGVNQAQIMHQEPPVFVRFTNILS